MSLKFLAIFIFVGLLPFSLYAKEISSPCGANDSQCPDTARPSKDTASAIPLKFERVVDGDTFVASGRKIRVWGINAPEKDEFGYLSAGWLLKSLVSNAILKCELIDVDRYKRDVMYCRANDKDVGSFMVRMGMAIDYKRYSKGFYSKDETFARNNKLGLWKYKK